MNGGLHIFSADRLLPHFEVTTWSHISLNEFMIVGCEK